MRRILPQVPPAGRGVRGLTARPGLTCSTMEAVAEVASHTWTCPTCGRRVPLRAEACHCGMTRARAEELAAAAPADARAPSPHAPGLAGPPLRRDAHGRQGAGGRAARS